MATIISKKKKLIKKNTIIILIIIILILIGLSFYFYQKSKKSFSNISEVQSIVTKVGKLMYLPTNETPTIATVSDPETLKDQAFFANAKLGYKVLIYTNAKEAILYDPFTNKIVTMAPLNIGDQKTSNNSDNIINSPATKSDSSISGQRQEF